MAKQQLHPAEQYARDVLDGRILACEYVKLACQRYFDDREHGPDRGIYFKENKAKKAIKFFQFVKHSKGEWAGRKFELSPWQQFILWNAFGFYNADDTRRFNYVYIEVAKKNGKTTFLAGVGNFMLIADGEQGAEVYSAALTRDQAKKCFNAAQSMVRKSGELKKLATVYTHNIHVMTSASKFEPLSSDYDSIEGVNPHGGIIDEYHVQKNTGIYDTLKSAMGARRNPMIWIITTAGFNKNLPCYTEREKVIKILEGQIKQDNYFGIVYTLDDPDNEWEDPSTWIKSNPNMGISPSERFLKTEYEDVKNSPAKLTNFLTKNLNIWTDAEEIWIKDKDFMACSGPDYMHTMIQKLEGKKCYGALDLASTRDITAFSLLFPHDDETFDFLLWCFVPEMTASERVKKDNVNYDVWIREGYIEQTPGNVTDYNYLFARLTGITKEGSQTETPGILQQFDVQSIQYDRWNATQLVIDLIDKNVNMQQFGQGFASMSTPTKQIEELILAQRIRHGGNPVLRWMNRNVYIQKDPAGNMKIDKAKSSDKVDGMVCLAMSIGGYLMAQSDKPKQPNVRVF
jgi:phage terminase large subunit-like protein